MLDWGSRIVSLLSQLLRDQKQQKRALYLWIQFDKYTVMQPTSKSGLQIVLESDPTCFFVWTMWRREVSRSTGTLSGFLYSGPLCRRQEVNRFPSNPQAPTEALVKHLFWSIGYSGPNFLRIKRRQRPQKSLIFVIAACLSVFITQFLLAPWPTSAYAVWKTRILTRLHILPWNTPPNLVHYMRPPS